MRLKILLFVLISALSFAFGAWFGRQQNTTQQTTAQIKETTQRQTVIVKDKDGREVTTINEHIDSVERIVEKKVEGIKHKTINISALAAVQDGKLNQVAYGLSLSAEVIGPITIGAFGLNSGMMGVSVGVNF